MTFSLRERVIIGHLSFPPRFGRRDQSVPRLAPRRPTTLLGQESATVDEHAVKRPGQPPATALLQGSEDADRMKHPDRRHHECGNCTEGLPRNAIAGDTPKPPDIQDGGNDRYSAGF